MTDPSTTIDEETKNPDPDFETEETLAYIIGRISEEIIEDQLKTTSTPLTIGQVEDLFP